MQLIDRVGRRLKLSDLHVLMTVVEAGSMSKAAERLNTSQPNVSRSIADLEHAFGVRLLDRQSGGAELTPFGRALLDCGLAVFDDLRQGVKRIEHLTDPTVGEIRIGGNNFLATSLVPAIVDRISRRYPRISFHIAPGDGSTNLRRLKARELDLLVAWKSVPYGDEQLVYQPLYEDPLVIVAGARHPLVRRRKIRLAELMNEAWVLAAPEGDLVSIALSVFAAAGLDRPRATVFCFSTDIRMNFLASGRFLTACPTSVFRFPRTRPEVKVLPVEATMPSVPIGIFTLKNRAISPVARLFLEHARSVAKSPS